MKFKGVWGLLSVPNGAEAKNSGPQFLAGRFGTHTIFLSLKPLLQKEYFRADDGSISDKVCYTIIYNCFYT